MEIAGDLKLPPHGCASVRLQPFGGGETCASRVFPWQGAWTPSGVEFGRCATEVLLLMVPDACLAFKC